MTLDFSQIPDKVYFRIGEVSELVGVETHVLRYWETEFSLIKPYRGKSKQRLFRRKDVETLLLIKDLLHHQGYTISGARKLLKQGPQVQEQADVGNYDHLARPASADILLQIKQELQSILHQLHRRKNLRS